MNDSHWLRGGHRKLVNALLFESPVETVRTLTAASSPHTAPPSILEVVRHHFSFDPDAMQEQVLLRGGKRLLLCCTRQWGKSTTAAALAAYRALTDPESLILAVSPTLRQTGELITKVRQFLEKAGCVLQGGQLSFQIGNGARVLGLPGKGSHVRGFSAPSLIVIDEAAQVEDLLYKSIRPMLAAGDGDLALLSTPFGERGFFWKEWAKGPEDWTRIEVKATDCPRIRPEFLAVERRVQGEEWFAQEYLCSFIGMENQAYRTEWLARAKAEGLRYRELDFQLKGRLR
ncbi:terminase large subunit domain-containing protein [Bryobacter aggregatus]|uniref:terminase large subunit domain-containing protein n=1 Tax=Bryobacter aggregatus TaxID=360054 RepID=UPI00056C2BF9|nr:terminase family protein [Bryobacter aggregatus]